MTDVTGYKVLRHGPRSGPLKDLYYGAYVNMPYREGRWVKAPKSLIDRGFGLTFFAELDRALLFAWEQGLDWVFKCIARGSMKVPWEKTSVVPNLGWALGKVLMELEATDDPGYLAQGSVFPVDTKMAERIKLVRKVDAHEARGVLRGFGLYTGMGRYVPPFMRTDRYPAGD